MKKTLVLLMVFMLLTIGFIGILTHEKNTKDKMIVDTSSFRVVSGNYVSKRIQYTRNSTNSKMFLELYTDGNSLEEAPVLIFIHGGGWWTGNKGSILNGEHERILQALVDEGFAVISIDYQLVNIHYNIELSIIDTKDAIRWIHQNAELYGFDEENIGLWGYSAGGHLAMMAAYSFDEAFIGNAELADNSSKVKYVISHAGPVDLVGAFKFQGKFDVYPDKEECDHMAYVTGVPLDEENYEETVARLRQYSPIVWMGPHCVPTLIIIGDQDVVVPVDQIDRMIELFDGYGISERLSYIKAEGATHWFSFDDDNSQKIKNKITDKTISYILSFK